MDGGVEDGWNFWGKVYENTELRTMMQQKSLESPSMAELLNSAALCQGELVVLNVPRIAVSQHNIVRQLLANHVRPHIPVLNITISNRRWIIRFYRKEDAADVMSKLDGLKYRGRCLTVRFNNNDCHAKPESNVVFEKLGIETEKIEEYSRIVERDIWSRTELRELNALKSELIQYLSRKEGTVCSIEELVEIGKKKRKGLVADAIRLWPLGVARLFTPDIRLTGKYMSLQGRDDHASLLRRASQEEMPLVPIDQWEGMPSFNLRTDHQLASYVLALLGHFGPQHVLVDVPWRLLSQSLRGSWPTNPVDLAVLVTEKSTSLVLFEHVLYSVAMVQHRRALVEVIQPEA